MVIIIKLIYFAYFVASSLLLKILFVGNEEEDNIVKNKILVAIANLLLMRKRMIQIGLREKKRKEGRGRKRRKEGRREFVDSRFIVYSGFKFWMIWKLN